MTTEFCNFCVHFIEMNFIENNVNIYLNLQIRNNVEILQLSNKFNNKIMAFNIIYSVLQMRSQG